MVSTWLWCPRRSRIAVATTWSPNTSPLFVAARDQLEQQIRSLVFQGQVAQFIDDQQPRLAVGAQRPSEISLLLRSRLVGDQFSRRAEQHAVAQADRFSAQKHQIVAIGDPTAARQFPDQVRVDRGLRLMALLTGSGSGWTPPLRSTEPRRGSRVSPLAHGIRLVILISSVRWIVLP